MVIEVKSEEEFNKLIHSKVYSTSIVDFQANWCPKCIMIEPLFKELSCIYSDIQFIKLDVDRLSEIAKNANVRAMPTFIIYKNGIQTNDIVKGADDEKLKKLIQSLSSKHESNSKIDSTENKYKEETMNNKNLNENDVSINKQSSSNHQANKKVERSYQQKTHHIIILLAIFVGYFAFTLYEMK